MKKLGTTLFTEDRRHTKLRTRISNEWYDYKVITVLLLKQKEIKKRRRKTEQLITKESNVENRQPRQRPVLTDENEKITEVLGQSTNYTILKENEFNGFFNGLDLGAGAPKH